VEIVLKHVLGSWVHLVWFGFYFLLFGILTGGSIIIFYAIFLMLAFSNAGERLWRWVSGIRPLRLNAERERLIPLFDEVYDEYKTNTRRINRYRHQINLYIQETMDINAFAFGKETLVLTKGSIDLLSDEAIKGLMAHELAHFHNGDTARSLFAYVANLPLSMLMKKLRKIDSTLESGFIRFVFSIFFAIFRFIEFLGDLILMRHSREQEYKADMLALEWGCGEELAGALIQLYQISMEKPKAVKDMLLASHPPLTMRIEWLEAILS